MVRLATASAFLLFACSSANAFAPATTGSSFVQTRTAFVRPVVVARAASTTTTTLNMNLFDRFSRVAKANINSVLKNLEDPEKILNQAVEDMQVR